MIYEANGFNGFLDHADLTIHETPGIGKGVEESWTSGINNIFEGLGSGIGTSIKAMGAALDGLTAHFAMSGVEVVSEAMPAPAIGAPAAASPMLGLDAAKSAVDKIGAMPMLAFASADRNDLGAMPSQLTNSAKPAQEQGTGLSV